jgi:hypothetical protein
MQIEKHNKSELLPCLKEMGKGFFVFRNELVVIIKDRHDHGDKAN